VDVIRELEEYGVRVIVHDPMADPEEAMHEYGLTLSPMKAFTGLEALIVAVGHQAYKDMPTASFASLFASKTGGLVMDIRGTLEKSRVAAAGLSYWRL
jgi:UDP-N-acetyl-D-galactosamine dehydrogenase